MSVHKQKIWLPVLLALGVIAVYGCGVGFGFLDTNIATQDASAVSKCTRESNNILKCGTSYIRFNIDLIYRLLLQKKDGRLNPDGISLDFMFGFNLIDYSLDENPYYLGNDYKGVHLGTAFSTPLGLPQLRLKAGSVEDVVTQHHAGGVIPDELAADDKGLRQSVRRRLFRVSEVHTVVRTVPEQALEARQVIGGGNDEDIPDTGQHQDGDRIVDHRLVIDGQKLLGNSFGDGIEAGAAAAGENDSFHNSGLNIQRYVLIC